jgi:hypothetical protein
VPAHAYGVDRGAVAALAIFGSRSVASDGSAGAGSGSLY